MFIDKPESGTKEFATFCLKTLSPEYLMICSKKGDRGIDEWNKLYNQYLKSEWDRLKEEDEFYAEFYLDSKDFKRIYLQSIDLSGLYLKNICLEVADLYNANLSESNLSNSKLGMANLKKTNLERTNLEKAALFDVNLEEAYLLDTILRGTNLVRTNFRGAYLVGAIFDGAALNDSIIEEVYMRRSSLCSSNLTRVKFSNSNLSNVNLDGADLTGVDISGADFSNANIKGSTFKYAIVNGKTLFTDNLFDNNTDFTGVGLSSLRIDPKLQTQLERIIRKKEWEKRYVRPIIYPLFASIRKKIIESFTHREDTDKMQKDLGNSNIITDIIRQISIKKLIKLIFIDIWVEIFWSISDYGTKTSRILLSFIGLNIIFSFIYYFIFGTSVIFGKSIDLLLAFIQSSLLVFCITDVATRDLGLIPMVFVLIHIVLGYLILAALVTRFAIMFQGRSP